MNGQVRVICQPVSKNGINFIKLLENARFIAFLTFSFLHFPKSVIRAKSVPFTKDGRVLCVKDLTFYP